MSTQIFVHKGKHINCHYKFGTAEEIQSAWLEHFRDNDAEEYYADVEGDEARYVELARAGNWKAAKRIAERRSGYEYEGFSIEPLYGPEDAAQ